MKKIENKDLILSFSHKNRGMLLEKIINQTINYYNKNGFALFMKKNLDIVINSKNQQDSFIRKKSTVDYYGIYKGFYIAFEAKSTELNHFPLSNIKIHQHQHLKRIKFLGGKAFYIIYFKLTNKFFMVDVETMEIKNKKSITLEEMMLLGNNLNITFPGIIDFLEYL